MRSLRVRRWPWLSGLVRPGGGPLAVVAAVVDRLDPGRHRGRRVWRSADGRMYIDLPGVGHVSGAAFARAAERALRDHPAVTWAVVNSVLGAAVIGSDGDVGVDELIDVLEAVQDAHRGPHRPEPAEPPGKPARPGPAAPSPSAEDAVGRAATAIVADVAGLTVGGVARLLRAARIPAELAALVTVVDSTPRLRSRLERALGTERADVALGVTNAVAQALAQGGSGLAVDLARRVLQLGEARARRSAWAGREPELAAGPELAAAGPVTRRRPVPLPAGPVERYSERADLAGLGALVVSLAATANPVRAGAVGLSALPKAATLGREGFAAVLGRALARRGTVLMDPRALRRLDRIGAVVLDADVLTTGRLMLGELVPTDHAGADELGAVAHGLFAPETPHAARRGDGFELAPMPADGPRGAGARARAGLLADGVTD
ncbi:MAG TPA: hypothetical protein VFX70_16280, partial [Mycobacteriales bacterium]|nr:hypothetical protein [Mycobacteriales bacterium]